MISAMDEPDVNLLVYVFKFGTTYFYDPLCGLKMQTGFKSEKIDLSLISLITAQLRTII